MKRTVDLRKLSFALETAKQYHQRYRGAVRYQEDLLTHAMEYESFGRVNSITDLVENFTYQLMVLLHPQLHNGPADVSVRGPGSGLGAMHVDALPHVIRKCWMAGNFDSELAAVIHDMILGWGVMEIRREDARVDNTPEAAIPVARHVHPDDLYVLPDAKRWEDCSCFFRRRVVSRDWLLAQAEEDWSWDADMIQQLPQPEWPSDGYYEHDDAVYFYEGWARPSTLEGSGLEPVPTKRRDEFDGVRFWINESGESIRPMAHHLGLEGTPYVLFGAMRSTARVYPMGVAVASGPNSDGVEAMIRHIEEQTHRMQKLIFARVNEKQLDVMIENAIDGVIPVGQFVTKEDIWDVDTHGPRREAWEFLQQRVDSRNRVSGITEMMQGKTGNRVSATEASIVHGGSNVRLDGLVFQQYLSLRRVVETMAFYASVDKDVSMYLGGDAGLELGFENPRWRGGLPDGVTFESLGLEFAVSNGNRLNPQLQSKQLQEGLMIANMVAEIKLRYPDSNVDRLLKKLMDSAKVPELRNLLLGEPAQEQPAQRQIGAPQQPAAQELPQVGQGGPIGMIA